MFKHLGYPVTMIPLMLSNVRVNTVIIACFSCTDAQDVCPEFDAAGE